jgi:hypothetical protein
MICDALRRIESRVLELPAHQIAAWLRGVFDGDGHVRTTPSCPQFVISAWKRAENQKIRSALLRIGIPVALSARAHVGKDGNIVVSGREMLRVFAHKVGSDHPKKQAAMDEVLVLLANRTGSSSRLDPVPVGGSLKAARESLGMGQRSFRRGHVVSAYERELNHPSRTSLVDLVEEIDDWRVSHAVAMTPEFECVRDLAQSAVLWARVEDIKALEPGELVYDLCLDRNNLFPTT